MQSANKYDWKDSNVELIGSCEDRSVKKSSAETEAAWNKVKVCNHAALFIWRIEKFKVVEWPKEQYGVFYEGDSYIILNIHEKGRELIYDLHFWIGLYSTQDEYGTAVYKTVELDSLLDDKPVQHREVQHYESELFKTYFTNLIYLKGGCESGFRIVNTQIYTPRLLRISGQKHNVIVSEVFASRKSLNSDDVYIYDTGTQIFQWVGKGANKDEKFKARQFAQQLNSDRKGKFKIELIDENDISLQHEFYGKLPDVDIEEDDRTHEALESGENQLFRISDATGSLKFEKVAFGNFPKSTIDENDVFIIDNGRTVYVYVGENASVNERKNALIYAHTYLKVTGYPQAPITVITKDADEQNAKLFNSNFLN